MAAIEYVSKQQLMDELHVGARAAYRIMHEIGVIRGVVAGGLVRRDALNRYMADRTPSTFYTRAGAQSYNPASARRRA